MKDTNEQQTAKARKYCWFWVSENKHKFNMAIYALATLQHLVL